MKRMRRKLGLEETKSIISMGLGTNLGELTSTTTGATMVTQIGTVPKI
jgi:hypothetical protein